MPNWEEALLALPPGPLEGDSDNIATQYLTEYWDQLAGATEESTTASKLHRAEALQWNPPILSFVLERHGGTVNGSTRAHLHHWEVDVRKRTADIVKKGHRQLYRQSARLNVKQLASDIAGLIASRTKCEKLRWKAENVVSVNIAEVIPDSYQSTTTDRRKRFYKALDEALAPHGWVQDRKGSWIYYVHP